MYSYGRMLILKVPITKRKLKRGLQLPLSKAEAPLVFDIRRARGANRSLPSAPESQTLGNEASTKIIFLVFSVQIP